MLKQPALVFLSRLGRKNLLFQPTQTPSWRNVWTYTEQLHRCKEVVPLPKESVPCPSDLLVQLSSNGPVPQNFLLLLKLIPMLQLSLQLRNTQLMVTKPFCIFFHSPVWLLWSMKGLPLFFCALLVLTANIFLPLANYLKSPTLCATTSRPAT